jgi:hypothetical protein
MKSKEATVAIIVAIIGLVGVLGAALIGNWDKIFGSSPTDVPPPPGGGTPDTGPTCNGTEVGGSCWYFGTENVSCDAVCASHDGYDNATRAYAGSDGSSGNCKRVLQALNIPLDDFFETTQGGIGCFAVQTTSGNYYGYWDSEPTTAGATYGTPGRRRICACQR